MPPEKSDAGTDASIRTADGNGRLESAGGNTPRFAGSSLMEAASTATSNEMDGGFADDVRQRKLKRAKSTRRRERVAPRARTIIEAIRIIGV